MKLLTGLFFLLISSVAFAQEPKPEVISRYIIMTGVIDKFPVTFHLYQTNNNFSGVYYYNNTEMPIELSGDMDKGHLLKLTHFQYTEGDDNLDESFDGAFKDSTYSGTWSYRGKKLNFSIALKKDSSGLAFDYIFSTGTKKIPKQDEMREEISFYAATIWPSADSKHPSVPLLQKIIRAHFEEKNSRDEIGKILIRRKNEILNATKDSLENGAPFELSDKLQVVYSDRKLLTLSYFNYGDYGGAHGIYGTAYTCIDLMHGKELKLKDVIDTLTAKKPLEELLVKKFRKDYNMKKEERLADMLLTDKIPLNDNFLLTSKGIAFNYLPYEIGAFSMGEITLFIPYKEIGPYIKPAFKKLINM